LSNGVIFFKDSLKKCALWELIQEVAGLEEELKILSFAQMRVNGGLTWAVAVQSSQI
jgi:hypothetical protein